MRRESYWGKERAVSLSRLAPLIRQAKRLAIRYRQVTGKPLGITGEVAEYEAARLVGVTLCPPRTSGYDAIGTGVHAGKRIQIKGRVLLPDAKPGQRLGSIRLRHRWDVVWLVELNENYNAVRIDEAPRAKISNALREPGSRSRNERGALSVPAFRKRGKQIWPDRG